MIPVKTNDIVVTGNLEGDKIAMGVHAASLQKLIGILTDLYSDPTQAIIREYSTNAIDSHIASGQTRPIEVSLPSPLSPYFRVRDFGLGMSVDDVRETYSQYGASTKDRSNDFNGMLGLGSKSALTYTNQFNVIAIKGGVKATVVVSRAADGTGTMEVVDTVSTTEGNGVEIVIPVKFSNDFETKARKFYSFWKPNTVLLNGKEPSLIKGNEVCPGVYSVHGMNEDFIVQGNVAYPVQSPGLYGQSYYKEFGVVAYVPNGSVAFAPSREALMYDGVTKAKIEQIRNDFANGLAASIQADLDDSIDHAEALVRFRKWKNMLGYALPAGLAYKGEVIPQRWDGQFLRFDPSKYRYQATNHRSIDYTALKGAMIITGFTGDSLSQAHKNKVKAFVEDNDLDVDTYILVDKMFGGKWTAATETATWDDIKAVKLNNGQRAAAAPRGKQVYKIWDTTTQWWKADPAPKVTPQTQVLYLSPQERIQDGVLRLLTSLVPDAMIVMLGRNRWEKFERDFPGAKHFTKAITEVTSTYTDHLTTEDKIILNMSSDLSSSLKRLDATQIDDPKVVELIKVVKNHQGNTKGIAHYNACRSLARHNGRVLAEVTTVVENPLTAYPLIPSGWNAPSKHHPHVYLYMNAAFAADN